MALGIYPHERFDGQQFVGVRLASAGEQLNFIGALICIKGDWQEFCSTLGFSNWQTKLSPCLHCFATKEDFLQDAELGVDQSPWPDFHMEDYLECCRASEVFVLVTANLFHSIKQALWYDRRQNGNNGRCLRWDIPGSILKEGDRLEPSAVLMDVDKFESIDPRRLPLSLTFWRKVQKRVKHRNPLFDALLGVTPDSLVVDSLHALNLGTLNRFAQELVWLMFWCHVWTNRRGRVQQDWIDLSVQGLRSELIIWEDEQQRAQPLHKRTKIQKLSSANFGVPSARNLKLKAAETNVFFLFFAI